jgi:16S rRNA G1207 methylase RsmC
MVSSHTHYFSPTAGQLGPTEELLVNLADRDCRLITAPGVFAAKRLDLGTSVLLRTLKRQAPNSGLPNSGTLVDLGCGWGALALTMALLAPAAEVWAIDINPQAREITRQNADLLGLSNVQVAGPQIITELSQTGVDRLWSNPPIRIGKPALHSLLSQWLATLLPNGWAALVVQRNLGADSLANWLASQNFPPTRLASAKGYRVFQVSQPPTTLPAP